MKLFKYIPLIILGAPLIASAQSTTSIQLPTDLTAQVLTQTNGTINGTSNYTELIIGVVLALVVIGELIMMLRSPK